MLAIVPVCSCLFTVIRFCCLVLLTVTVISVFAICSYDYCHCYSCLVLLYCYCYLLLLFGPANNFLLFVHPDCGCFPVIYIISIIMDILANVTNLMVKKVDKRVDDVNVKVCECERRMGVVESENGAVSELVSKVKENKECLVLVKEDVLHVSGCVDDSMKKMDGCIRKIDDYEVGMGVCNERVSVCENKVRDFVSKESLYKVERSLRNELREEKEKRIKCEREVRSLGRQVRDMQERMDERERERDSKRRDRVRVESEREDKRKREEGIDEMWKMFKKLDKMSKK